MGVELKPGMLRPIRVGDPGIVEGDRPASAGEISQFESLYRACLDEVRN